MAPEGPGDAVPLWLRLLVLLGQNKENRPWNHSLGDLASSPTLWGSWFLICKMGCCQGRKVTPVSEGML